MLYNQLESIYNLSVADKNSKGKDNYDLDGNYFGNNRTGSIDKVYCYAKYFLWRKNTCD